VHEIDDEDDATRWTPEGAAALRDAAAALAAAVTRHAEAVTAVTGHAGVREVVAASDALAAVARDYADAQVAYCGTGYPFDLVDEDADDEDDEDDDEPWPPPGRRLSVESRHEFVVADPEALMAAGRAAYLEVWPDDDEAAAAADVQDLGRALYQVAHAAGWGEFEAPGLEPTVSEMQVVTHDDDEE